MSKTPAGGDQKRAEAGRSATVAPALDAQYAELIEMVWHCERVWKLQDRIDAKPGNCSYEWMCP